MEQDNMLVAKKGWSLGGFMFNVSFLIAIKRYKLIWWYLLILIPIVNIFFMIIFMIYLGIKGHALATGGTQFANQSEYDGFIKGINHAGKVIFIAMVAILVIAMVFALSGHSLNFLSPHM